MCSGLDDACYPTNEMIDVGVEFHTDNKINKIIFLKCRIFHLSKLDLIIGRPSIKKYKFSQINSTHFGDDTPDISAAKNTNPPATLKRKIDNKPSWVTKVKNTTLDRTQSSLTPAEYAKPTQVCQTTSPIRETPTCACHHCPKNSFLAGGGSAKEGHRCPLSPAERLEPRTPERVAETCDGIVPERPLSANTQQLVIATLQERDANTTYSRMATAPDVVEDEMVDRYTFIPAPTPEEEKPYLVAALTERDEIKTYSRMALAPDEIDDETVDTFAPFLPDPTPEKEKPYFLDSITIEGDEGLQRAIRALCIEYADIFSDTLGALPADIPPFKIEVKASEWETYKNSTPVRPQTAKKEAEIAKHVGTMMGSSVVEASNAHYWSHPVVVDKPDKTTRFCIDFRALNACSQPGTFPLPVIAATLLRIGEHKPDTFGVMDLTSGYHQAPLHPDSRILTAFICFSGVYQFTRVPFGPTRAPSYFQEMMSAVVLCGLVYFICEMYLDDCIVFGRGNEEFVTRLRQVFQRFRFRRIFLKAKKCKLGLKKIGYVGKEISEHGISMSDDKIQHVLDFPKPMTNTQLRSFLGLANYFREFVPNHSHVVHPLQSMIDFAATKRTAIKWSPEGETAFVEVKRLIAQCPLLNFVNDSAPITVMTDASDYGIGGYLFQRVDEIDQPVAFISKSLTEDQLRWSTIQKEAYAIFFCCTKLNPLLRDRKFTILTDHSNLLFLQNDSNQMVVRWWLAIQELDYTLRFVPGVENIIADALSRLCPNLLKLQPGETPEVATEVLAAISVREPLPNTWADIIVTCHSSHPHD